MKRLAEFLSSAEQGKLGNILRPLNLQARCREREARERDALMQSGYLAGFLIAESPEFSDSRDLTTRVTLASKKTNQLIIGILHSNDGDWIFCRKQDLPQILKDLGY